MDEIAVAGSAFIVGVLVLAFVYFVWLDGRSMRLALAVTAVLAAGVIANVGLTRVVPDAGYWMQWASMAAAVLVVRRFDRRPS